MILWSWLLANFRKQHKLDFAMTWNEIARALGYRHSASVKWIYDKAMRKLRFRYSREDIKDILNGQISM